MHSSMHYTDALRRYISQRSRVGVIVCTISEDTNKMFNDHTKYIFGVLLSINTETLLYMRR